MRSQVIRMAVVIAVFSASAVVNSSLADGLFNAECFSGTCADVSQRCSPEGSACTRCSGQTYGKYCGTLANATCSSLDGTMECGTQYSGICQNTAGGKKCVGLNNGQPGCLIEKCNESTPSEP